MSRRDGPSQALAVAAQGREGTKARLQRGMGLEGGIAGRYDVPPREHIASCGAGG